MKPMRDSFSQSNSLAADSESDSQSAESVNVESADDALSTNRYLY